MTVDYCWRRVRRDDYSHLSRNIDSNVSRDSVFHSSRLKVSQFFSPPSVISKARTKSVRDSVRSKNAVGKKNLAQTSDPMTPSRINRGSIALLVAMAFSTSWRKGHPPIRPLYPPTFSSFSLARLPQILHVASTCCCAHVRLHWVANGTFPRYKCLA